MNINPCLQLFVDFPLPIRTRLRCLCFIAPTGNAGAPSFQCSPDQPVQKLTRAAASIRFLCIRAALGHGQAERRAYSVTRIAK